MSKPPRPSRPLVGVGAVIFDDKIERVLLIERGHPPARGAWSVPGGLVEGGEALAAACAREAREETGLEVDVAPQPVKVIERVIRQRGAVRHHYLIVDFLASVKGGTLRAGDDAAAAEWVALNTLEGRPTTAGLKQALLRAREVALGKQPESPLLTLIDGEEEAES